MIKTDKISTLEKSTLHRLENRREIKLNKDLTKIGSKFMQLLSKLDKKIEKNQGNINKGLSKPRSATHKQSEKMFSKIKIIEQMNEKIKEIKIKYTKLYALEIGNTNLRKIELLHNLLKLFKSLEKEMRSIP